MVAIFTEDLLTLNQATTRIPGRPHITTVWRWATHGIGPDRTRLETVTVGGRRFTSIEAIQRFVAALNAPDNAPPVRPDQNAGPEEAERQLSPSWE